tara:strand:+ start:1009 stop:1131 length:123 start_codon:yes stop_codon:yes gene_type:complete
MSDLFKAGEKWRRVQRIFWDFLNKKMKIEEYRKEKEKRHD